MKYSLVGKSILIIDDYAAMRKSMRDMLQSLGANKIYEAENGVNAISTMQKRKFYFVFCDHNLGVGKNGQQILEEARHRKLIDENCIFFMVSAENNIKKLLGVMDSKPDDFLVKPFNTQQLDSRLQHHYSRKRSMAEVEQEVEKGNIHKAILHLDHTLAGHDKKMHTFLLKRRAELAITAGDFATAKKIYENTLANRELPWAKLGLGIIEFQQNNFEPAIAIFEQLIAEQPHFMEGYDWLCKAYEAFQKLDSAQNTLSQAVKLLPEAILRQKKLASVADKNGDLQVAENAFKSVIALGKHSVHKSCSDFVGLAKVYVKKNAGGDALTTLQNMRSQFEHSPEAELMAATLETEVYQNQGLKDSADQALQKMLRYTALLTDTLTKEAKLDIIRTCYLSQQSAKANEMLGELIDNAIEDEVFLAEIKRILKDVNQLEYVDSLIKATKRKLIAINNQGVALFQQAKYQEAAELFEQAIIRLPNNKTIRFNMLKVLIKDMLEGNYTEDKLSRCKTLIMDAEKIGVDQLKLEAIKVQLVAIENKNSIL